MELIGYFFLAAVALASTRAAADNKTDNDGHRTNSGSLMWVKDACEVRRTTEQREALKECVKWASGLEHESLLVHRRDNGLDESVVNVGTVVTQMSRFGRIFGLDRKKQSVALSLGSTGVEFLGRECASMKEINFRAMAETVSLGHSQMSYDSAFCQIEVLDKFVVDVLSTSPGELNVTSTLGPIRHPRTGMSTQLGLYTRTRGKTYNCATCSGCDLKDYTGSNHISMSLPMDAHGWVVYDEAALKGKDTCSKEHARSPEEGETPLDVWVQAHENLGNKFQWVEPLIMAVMGSCDADAVCDSGEFVEGSYRTMSSGWGVPGTTDVRIFNEKGVGRYTKTGFQWLLDAAPTPDADIFGCVDEGMGADIRTISSVDEHLLSPGEELPPMELGRGLEFRVFDNFPLGNLPRMYQLLVLIAESSRLHRAEEYVYEDQRWASAAIEAMREGWNAVLPHEYVSGVAENLNVDLSALGSNTQAFDVFSQLFKQLWTKHSNGTWTGEFPHIFSPNRESWEVGAINKGITPSKIMDMFAPRANGTAVDVDLGELEVLSYGCDYEDYEDLVYLAQSYNMVERMIRDPSGSVVSVSFVAGAAHIAVEEPTCFG